MFYSAIALLALKMGRAAGAVKNNNYNYGRYVAVTSDSALMGSLNDVVANCTELGALSVRQTKSPNRREALISAAVSRSLGNQG